VIATTLPSIAELVEDGVTGALVPRRIPRRWRGLERLMRAPAERRGSRRRRGRVARFTLERIDALAEKFGLGEETWGSRSHAHRVLCAAEAPDNPVRRAIAGWRGCCGRRSSRRPRARARARFRSRADRQPVRQARMGALGSRLATATSARDAAAGAAAGSWFTYHLYYKRRTGSAAGLDAARHSLRRAEASCAQAPDGPGISAIGHGGRHQPRRRVIGLNPPTRGRAGGLDCRSAGCTEAFLDRTPFARGAGRAGDDAQELAAHWRLIRGALARTVAMMRET